MTRQQEQRIFGNVLPDELKTGSEAVVFLNSLKGTALSLKYGWVAYTEIARHHLQTERQRRESIARVIEYVYLLECMKICTYSENIQWLESTLSKPWSQIKAEWKGE